MTTTTPGILLAASIAALSAPGATAAANVYGPRDWETPNQVYPCLLVRIASDQGASDTRNSISFTAVTTILVVCRCSAPGGAGDSGALEANYAAWAMSQQVLSAIINAPTIMPLLQQYPTYSREEASRSEGDYAICDVGVSIAMEYHLDANDFAPILSSDITEMTGATNPTDFADGTQVAPGIDVTFS